MLRIKFPAETTNIAEAIKNCCRLCLKDIGEGSKKYALFKDRICGTLVSRLVYHFFGVNLHPDHGNEMCELCFRSLMATKKFADTVVKSNEALMASIEEQLPKLRMKNNHKVADLNVEDQEDIELEFAGIPDMDPEVKLEDDSWSRADSAEFPETQSNEPESVFPISTSKNKVTQQSSVKEILVQIVENQKTLEANQAKMLRNQERQSHLLSGLNSDSKIYREGISISHVVPLGLPITSKEELLAFDDQLNILDNMIEFEEYIKRFHHSNMSKFINTAICKSFNLEFLKTLRVGTVIHKNCKFGDTGTFRTILSTVSTELSVDQEQLKLKVADFLRKLAYKEKSTNK